MIPPQQMEVFAMTESAENEGQLAVKVRLERILNSVPLQKAHSERAANAISQFIHVAQGLRGHVPDVQIHSVAAALTAAIVSRD
jgi:NADH:ubiquinone oxidoreductase subunit E